MVVGWALYYFMSSMSNPLPWASCPVVNRTRFFILMFCEKFWVLVFKGQTSFKVKISGLETKATLDGRGWTKNF